MVAMRPDVSLTLSRPGVWTRTVASFAIAWIALLWVTWAEWSEMAHQWWDIDTYSHILLVPPIILWMAWMKLNEVSGVRPTGWWPALIWFVLGMAVWFGGRAADVNLLAQVGTIASFQGAALAILGLRTGLVLAFPLTYMVFLVPFGDEIIPWLQYVTAEMATEFSRWSGIETVADGINIDTPAGLFVVAEECSGVKFLIAMIALGVLVAHSCFESWTRRFWFMLACIVVPIVANGIRAWATIFIAQYVGAEAAGSFDHIVYGWVFFGLVIALVLGVAWRWFEREPEDAGWSAAEVAAMPSVRRIEGRGSEPVLVLGAVLAVALLFAVLERLG